MARSLPWSVRMASISVKLSTVRGWIRELDPKRQWLSHDIVFVKLVREMHCSLCRKHEMQLRTLRNYSASYVKGVRGSSLKKDGLRKHATSEQHLKAHSIEYPVNVTDTHLQSTTVEKQEVAEEGVGEEIVAKLVEVAYQVAKKDIPFARFEDIVELEARHGVDFGKRHHNDKTCHELVLCVNEAMVEDLKITLGKSEFFSLFSDGSADSGVVEKELMCVLFVNSSGSIECRLLRLKNVLDGTAPGLKSLIEQCFGELGISDLSSHLVGLGVDGAGVNLGCRKGLITLLKKANVPWLVGNHCLNHRLQLAIKKSFEKTYMDDMSDTLMSLYYLYQNSPKKPFHLRNIAKLMEERVRKPLKWQGTRWVQHQLQVCQALLQSYAIVVTQLSSMASDPALDTGKARCVLKQLLSCKFVLHLLFFSKLLEPISRVGLAWQSNTVNLPSALSVLQHLQELLESGSTSFIGEDISKIIEQCEEYNPRVSANPQPDSKVVFRGHELQQINGGLKYFRNHVEKYVHDVEKCIFDCFSDLDTGLLKCSKLLDTRLWPMSEESFTLSYGNNDIKQAATHFHQLILKHISPTGMPIRSSSRNLDSEDAPVHKSKRLKSSSSTEGLDNFFLDVESEFDHKLHQRTLSIKKEEEQGFQSDLDILISGMLIEWGEFKCHVLENMSHFVKSPEDVWSRLHAMYDVTYPRLKLLIQCLRVIPLSNAMVERCFSTVNKMKSDWRAALSDMCLEALVRIKKEGPPLAKFDSRDAVDKFFATPRMADGENLLL